MTKKYYFMKAKKSWARSVFCLRWSYQSNPPIKLLPSVRVTLLFLFSWPTAHCLPKISLGDIFTHLSKRVPNLLCDLKNRENNSENIQHKNNEIKLLHIVTGPQWPHVAFAFHITPSYFVSDLCLGNLSLKEVCWKDWIDVLPLIDI